MVHSFRVEPIGKRSVVMVSMVVPGMANLIADARHENGPSIPDSETLALMSVQPPVDVVMVSDEEEKARLFGLLGYKTPAVAEFVLYTMGNSVFPVLRDRKPSEGVRIFHAADDSTDLRCGLLTPPASLDCAVQRSVEIFGLEVL
jgi:hypothetical protein